MSSVFFLLLLPNGDESGTLTSFSFLCWLLLRLFSLWFFLLHKRLVTLMTVFLPVGFPACFSATCSRCRACMRLRLRTESAAAPRQNGGRRFFPKLWTGQRSPQSNASYSDAVDGHQPPQREETPPQQGLSDISSKRKKKHILMILF